MVGCGLVHGRHQTQLLQDSSAVVLPLAPADHSERGLDVMLQCVPHPLSVAGHEGVPEGGGGGTVSG